MLRELALLIFGISKGWPVLEFKFCIYINHIQTQGKKASRQLDLGERMSEEPLNINPETYTKVRVNRDTNQKSKLVLVKIFKV